MSRFETLAGAAYDPFSSAPSPSNGAGLFGAPPTSDASSNGADMFGAPPTAAGSASVSPPVAAPPPPAAEPVSFAPPVAAAAAGGGAGGGLNGTTSCYSIRAAPSRSRGRSQSPPTFPSVASPTRACLSASLAWLCLHVALCICRRLHLPDGAHSEGPYKRRPVPAMPPRGTHHTRCIHPSPRSILGLFSVCFQPLCF